MWANVRAVWGAATIALSASIYLLDFCTTMNALVAYYYFQYHCPYALPDSALLRRDPICRAIRSNPVLHSIAIEFWTCLSFLLLAHLTYAFIFWISLHPRDHPFRLAYFMPLIHLYRLLKLLCNGFSFKALDELTQRQRETNSLYNALGAALETAPQFSLQFVIAVKLGNYIAGSSDLSLQAHRIPTKLILSLVASMISGCYSTSMAVSLLMGQHMPFTTKVCVGIVVGCQALVTMLARTMNIAALAEISHRGFSIPILIYMIIGVVIAWIFVSIAFESHHYDRNKCLRIAHSFGLALMIRTMGPIYMIVKHRKSSCLLIWGALSHISVEIIGLGLLFVWPNFIKQESLCHTFHIIRTKEKENKYLTCKVFLGTMFPSLLVFILTTILFVWLNMGSGKNARKIPSTSTDSDIVRSQTTSSNVTYSSNNCDIKYLHQMSTQTFFKLTVFVVIVLFIMKLQKKYVLKGQAR